MLNTLEDFLEAPEGAGSLLAHARLLLRITHLYSEIAPSHLYQASTVANYKSGFIVIHAENGAVATKLRQLANTLAQGFSKRGIECSGVLVKVQVKTIEAKSGNCHKKPLSSSSLLALRELHDSLPASELREAVGRLIQRSAKAE